MADARTKKIPISSLVEDLSDSLYPRSDVDGSHVNLLARALQSGATLPPIVADAKSKRIIDGVHRRRAYLRVYGSQAEVDVELRSYKSAADMARDAVALNTRHGKPLDATEATRCALMLQRHGLLKEQIAVAMSTTQDRVQQLLVRVVIVNGQPQPAKPVVWSGGDRPRKLTPDQYQVTQSASGWKSGQTVTQLTNELRAGVLDLKNEKLVEALWMLHDIIAEKAPPMKREVAA